jgi:nicotinate-nucleotide adenylyltransferase
MNLGVIGGTFDPVHLGHLAIAEEARRRLNMLEVIFVPAGQPYFKDLAEITPIVHRVSMLNLALEGRPYFKISLIEIERPGPSYAVETIVSLRERLKPEDEIYFIMGWDSIMSLPLWREPRRLMSLCRFAAVPRPGYPIPDTSVLEKDLPGVSERIVVLDEPLLNISSTEIRRRVREGISVEDLVPESVAAYIEDHGLYKKTSGV